MSQSISEQLDAAVATLSADNAAMAAALITIQSELSAVSAGNITQAQIDALNAAVAGASSQVATAQSEANPTPPATP